MHYISKVNLMYLYAENDSIKISKNPVNITVLFIFGGFYKNLIYQFDSRHLLLKTFGKSRVFLFFHNFNVFLQPLIFRFQF